MLSAVGELYTLVAKLRRGQLWGHLRIVESENPYNKRLAEDD
jgi:hypothetical protein